MVIENQRKKSIGEGNKEDPKKICERILKGFPGLGAEHWQLGTTKVFLREQVELLLEKERYTYLNIYVKKIQRLARRFLARRRRQRMIANIIKIQKGFPLFFFLFFFFFFSLFLFLFLFHFIDQIFFH